ncbi:lipid II flippase MurJ [Arcticibacter sp. MXS-1]|uniref:lipid II flippase MurJ n=1 Tax=Arcticibacter sp. MXS-1 TaxID=3341726 RepID=UPI0035A9026B
MSQLVTAVFSLWGLNRSGIKLVWAAPRHVINASEFWPILSSLLVSYFLAQIYVLVERATMVRMASGLVASFQYSIALVNIGISIIVQPINNLVWPKFLEENASNDRSSTIRTTENAIVMVVLILLVGCVFVYSNAYEIITLIYSRGNFDQKSVYSTGDALRATIFTAIPIGIYGILTRVLITRGHGRQLALAASSIAIVGIGVIVLAFFTQSKRLIMYHWFLGNTFGAVLSFVAVKKHFKELFFLKRYPSSFAIKVLCILGIATFLSSSNIFANICSPLISLIIRFIVYSCTCAVLAFSLKIYDVFKLNGHG